MAHMSGSWDQGSMNRQSQLSQHGLSKQTPVASRQPLVCRQREEARPIRHSAACTHAALVEPSCPFQLSPSLPSSLPRQTTSAQTVGQPWGSSRQRAQARALTKAIKGCHHWRELYALLAMQDSRDVNSVHIAAAMHHCSLISQKGGMSASEQRDMQAWLDQYLLPKVKQLLPTIRARELVTVLHAVAALQHVPHPGWLIAICNTVQQLLSTFTSRDSASSLWAISHILQCTQQLQQQQILIASRTNQGSHTSSILHSHTINDGGMFHLSVETTVSELLIHNLQHIHSANSQDVANVLFAAGYLQKLGLNLATLPMHNCHFSSYSQQQSSVSAVDASLLSTAHMQLVQLNGCSHTAGSHSSEVLSWHAWQSAYLQASVQLLHSCDAHALSNIAWGLHNMSGAGEVLIPSTWKSTFQNAVTAQLGGTCPQGLVALLSAVPALGWQYDSQWVMQLLSAIETLLPYCSLQDLCDVGRVAPWLMQACMANGVVQQQVVNRWWQTFEGAAVARLRYAQPKHYALLLCSIAHANRKCNTRPAHATLLAWFHGASSCIRSWSSLDAAQALTAMAALRLTPHAQFMESLLLCVRNSAQSSHITHFVGIMQALAHMQYNPGWQFMLYMYNTTASTPVTQHDSQSQGHELQIMLRVGDDPAMLSSSNNGFLQQQHSQRTQQNSQQPSLMALSVLINSVACLKQRPMAHWTQWLLATLPGSVSAAMPVLQWTSRITNDSSSLMHSKATNRLPDVVGQQLVSNSNDSQATPQRTARAIATIVHGLLRLHIVPSAALLKQLLGAATASVQYLSGSQCLKLLSCTARLFRNCRSAVSQPGIHCARRRRSDLKGATIPVNSQQKHSLSRACSNKTQSTPIYKTIVRRLRTPHRSISKVSFRKNKPAGGNQDVEDIRAGLLSLAEKVLTITEPHLNDMTISALNQSFLCTASTVQVLPEISRSRLRFWLHAWLTAHKVAQTCQSDTFPVEHEHQGKHRSKTTLPRQSVNQQRGFVRGARRSFEVDYLLLSGLAKLLPLACTSNNIHSNQRQQQALLFAAKEWLLACLPAVHAASCPPCPASLLPAVVDVAEMCDCLEAVVPIVHSSLLHAMKASVGDDETQQAGAEQRVTGTLSGLPLLQLGQSVVRTDAHRLTIQAQLVEHGTAGFTTGSQVDVDLVVSRLVLGLQLVIDKQHLLHHHRQLAQELVLRLQTNGRAAT